MQLCKLPQRAARVDSSACQRMCHINKCQFWRSAVHFNPCQTAAKLPWLLIQSARRGRGPRCCLKAVDVTSAVAAGACRLSGSQVWCQPLVLESTGMASPVDQDPGPATKKRARQLTKSQAMQQFALASGTPRHLSVRLVVLASLVLLRGFKKDFLEHSSIIRSSC